jgi:hypothetical protein
MVHLLLYQHVPTSVSPSGRHRLDLVLSGNANQNISQEAGMTNAGFANLIIDKTGGIANFNAGTYNMNGELTINCVACTNFRGFNFEYCQYV